MTAIRNLKRTEIASADTKTLRQHLVAALTLTAKQLGYLAEIWRELEVRGEDLSDLRSGIAAYLPMIANGSLDAELVVKYAGQKMLLAAVARLPIDEQRRLAVEGFVTVASIGAEGDRTEVETPLHRLSATDVRYVFGERHLRTPAEQLLLLEKPKKSQARQRFKKVRKVTLDPIEQSIIVGSSSVAVERLLPLLSEYYGLDIEDLIAKNQRS